MLRQHHFWQLNVSQSVGSSPTDLSLKASSHHPSRPIWLCLPPLQGKHVFQTSGGGLSSPGCTASHKQGKGGRKFPPTLPTGTATSLTGSVYLKHLPPRLFPHMGRHTSFQNVRVKMKRWEVNTLNIYIIAPGWWFRLYLDIRKDYEFKLIKSDYILKAAVNSQLNFLYDAQF